MQIAQKQSKCEPVFALLLVMLSFVLTVTSAQAGGDKNGVPTKSVPVPIVVKTPPAPPVLAVPSPAPLRCGWVEVETVTYTASRTFGTPAMKVPVCGGHVWLGGSHYSTSGDTFRTVTLREVCR